MLWSVKLTFPFWAIKYEKSNKFAESNSQKKNFKEEGNTWAPFDFCFSSNRPFKNRLKSTTKSSLTAYNSTSFGLCFGAVATEE